MRMAAVLVVGAIVSACSSGDGRDLRAAADVEATVGSTIAGATTPQSVPGSSTMSAPTPGSADDVGKGVPLGFDTVAGTITDASGEECDVCLWLASTPEQRARGLMGVTDLGDGDAMLFRYDLPTTTQFWMRNTPMPLSIAFFDDVGTYLDTVDMDPCLEDSCPRYPTALDFVDAIEFPQGTVGEFGVGPGSVLEVSDLPCP